MNRQPNELERRDNGNQRRADTTTKDRRTTPGRKKTRRSAKKVLTNCLTIWYNNINGINSKLESLQTIINIDRPHIIVLTETKTSKCPNLDNYTWIKETKPSKAGGVAIAARNDIANHTTDVDVEKESDMEIAWVKVKSKQGSIHIGGFYGKQENEKKEKVEHEYSQLSTQVIRLKRDGHVILAGDFNAKIELESESVSQKESRNGKILQRTLRTTGTMPINNQEDTIKWTRVNRNKEDERSVIDYIITDAETKDNLVEIYIDEMGTHRPKGKNETDHNTIIAKFKVQAKKAHKGTMMWEFNNETDWKKYNNEFSKTGNLESYEDLTATIKEALRKVSRKKQVRREKQKTGPLGKQQRKIMKEEKKKFEKECRSNGRNKKILYDKYMEARQKLQRMIEADQKKRTQEIANKLIKEGGVKSPHFWKLRNQLKGNSCPEYDLVTEDDRKVTDPAEAKAEIAKYYNELYKPWEGKGYCENWTNKICQEYEIIQTNMKELPKPIPISKKEINMALRKMKEKKAAGPDDIPNEALKRMNPRNREKLRKILNKILITADIPNDWTESYITRLYKGKGVKGKCSSERGITLSSNIGKMFERIINERILEKINITDEQAGGRKKRATTDHINVLKTIIRGNKTKKRPTYVVFLDVTKAYDKAWLKAIMYVLHKEGLMDRTWKIAEELNKNLKAQIRTQHGMTEKIHINDSIRQGGVLSVIQYALLMDEISKINKYEDIGAIIPGTDSRINTLLWMDDVALIADNLEDLRKLVDNTDYIANKYHISFGKDKSKILKIGGDPNNREPYKKIYLGKMELEYTDKYKYLGLIMNNKLNLKDHLQTIKGKTEAAYQTILNLLYNKAFRNIQMKTAWKLLETCIIPVITYACETWLPTKTEIKTINKILDDIIKRMLMTPFSTPREALYIETNLMDAERIIDKKKINMYYRITKNPTSLTRYLTQDIEKTQWMRNVEDTAAKYNINLNALTDMTRHQSKKYIRKTIHRKFREHLFETAETKSKTTHLTRGYLRNEKATYTNTLTREQTSIIFKARNRMIDVKDNYKNKYSDNVCRLCKQTAETQRHVLEECPVTRQNGLTVKYENMFSRSTPVLENVAVTLKRNLEQLNDSEQNTRNN